MGYNLSMMALFKNGLVSHVFAVFLERTFAQNNSK